VKNGEVGWNPSAHSALSSLDPFRRPLSNTGVGDVGKKGEKWVTSPPPLASTGEMELRQKEKWDGIPHAHSSLPSPDPLHRPWLYGDRWHWENGETGMLPLASTGVRDVGKKGRK
jgi:hypothetical protein